MGNILFINNNETALLERLRKNDSVAQRQLFDAYQKKLLTVCFRYLNDEDEALDALNRSFLKMTIRNVSQRLFKLNTGY